MRKVVIDTNVYVDWLNAGRHEAVLFDPDVVKYLSSVVVMELLAGAFSVRERRIVRRLIGTFRGTRRVLAPSPKIFEESGSVLQRLQALGRYDLRRSHSIVNDVLIALSARAIGATVFTQNRGDYMAIRTIRPFELQVVT